MAPAAQIAWIIGMIPGWIAVYWAYKKDVRKFAVWGALCFAFWVIGIVLDMHAGNP